MAIAVGLNNELEPNLVVFFRITKAYFAMHCSHIWDKRAKIGQKMGEQLNRKSNASQAVTMQRKV